MYIVINHSKVKGGSNANLGNIDVITHDNDKTYKTVVKYTEEKGYL